MSNFFTSAFKPLFIGLALLSITSTSALAEDYSITLKGNGDEAIQVAVLTTSEAETTKSDQDEKDKEPRKLNYKIKWENAKFEDHFLSMRPFKCLPSGEKLWCHAPYPYEIKRQINEDDVTDLEYDLIFVWKPEGEYGINLWNGVYYKLEATDFGWKGTMREYDLNVLGVPPEAGELRPIRKQDLHEASVEDHFLPFIEIRKVQ